MLLLSDDAFLGHATPGGHPERPDRLRWILAEWDRAGILSHAERAPIRPATREEILRVHASSLVDSLERLARAGGGPVDGETVVSAGSWRAATLAAGAAILAAESAAAGRPAFALVRPPGHHADRARAQGFCLLNHVAVAAESAIARGLARRVAIVDFDVHHGNGTQDVFYERGDVLYVSTHNAPLYPGTGAAEETGAGAGAGRTVNLPLPHGAGERTWKAAIDAIALPAIVAFEADLVLVSAGFDAHWRDPLGMMRLSSDAFGWFAERLLAITPRVASVLEGGYDPRGLAEGSASFAAALAGSPVRYGEHAPPDLAPPDTVERLLRAHEASWSRA